MSDSGITVPVDISKLLDERVRVWEDYDQAQSKAKEINQLSLRLSTETPVSIADKLSDGLPPHEIAESLRLLQVELDGIAKARADVESYHKKIQEIRTWIFIEKE